MFGKKAPAEPHEQLTELPWETRLDRIEALRQENQPPLREIKGNGQLVAPPPPPQPYVYSPRWTPFSDVPFDYVRYPKKEES